MYTLFSMLLVTSVYFFAKTSSTAEKGYSFKESQIRLKELESKNRILQQEVLDAQSLQKLKSSETVSNMLEPESSIYIAPKGPLSKRK